MRLVGRDRISRMKEANPDDEEASKWLTAWASEISYAQWSEASELFEQFPTAQRLEGEVYRFEVNGILALDVLFSFSQKIACVLSLSTK